LTSPRDGADNRRLDDREIGSITASYRFLPYDLISVRDKVLAIQPLQHGSQAICLPGMALALPFHRSSRSPVPVERRPMLVNLLMLALAYGMLIVPILWLTRPIRMVNPF
jgi:hypothetical protein